VTHAGIKKAGEMVDAIECLIECLIGDWPKKDATRTGTESHDGSDTTL
jgi:hypothetical protein